MTKSTKRLILSIEFILAPAFTYLVVARLGVSAGAFIISGIAWLLVFWFCKALDAFMQPEAAKETQAIDEEVERMEGRRIRINNNFDVCIPEGFKCVSVDSNTMRVTNLATKHDSLVSIDLRDRRRITDIVNSTIKELQ
jgi:hypothetical protein